MNIPADYGIVYAFLFLTYRRVVDVLENPHRVPSMNRFADVPLRADHKQTLTHDFIHHHISLCG